VRATNYTALDLLQDMRKGIWKEVAPATNVTIYRRNLQRAYLERMNFLMNEELKAGTTTEFYNVPQSDVRGLVRGELNVLKTTLSAAKNTVINTETKYHYQDCIKRIETILDPK
jgi:hypothetical protein